MIERWMARGRVLWRKFFGWQVVTPRDIEEILHQPVLAIIPHLERRRQKETLGLKPRRIDLEGRWRSRLLIHFPVDCPAASAYGTLVDDFRIDAQQHGRKLLLLTSTVSGEGTSLACVNLSIVAKRHGLRALVVEGHSRAPRISTALNLDIEPGLTGGIQRSLPASQVIQKSSMTGIEILPAGRSVAYPEALWRAPGLQRILNEVRSTYDLVFIEGAPVSSFQDTPVLAEKVEGIVWVHQFGRVTAEQIRKACGKLGAQQEKILGVLLNDVPTRVR